MQDLTTKNDGIKRDSKRIKANGEVFTPKDLVEQMLAKIPEETWKDPKKTFLEPTFGSGNMLICMLEKRINSGVKPIDALKTLYGVELMQDNVDLCKERIKTTLREYGVKINKKILEIIDHNFVCSDFFKWDFDNWCSKEAVITKETCNGLYDFFI